MADFGKPKDPAGIPAWQRRPQQQPPDQSSPAAPSNRDASDASDVAAKQEFEASKVITSALQSQSQSQSPPQSQVQSQSPSGTPPSNTTSTSSSNALNTTPSNATSTAPSSATNTPPGNTTDTTPSNTTDTDGSDTAAKQEFDASKRAPDGLRDPSTASANPSATDGSDTAARQEFNASKQVIGHVRAFLDDPQVKDAPLEKKRLFLESKGIQPELITEALATESAPTSWSTADFLSSARAPTPTHRPQETSLPPIVTYPEFLIQPQKPPPLVTINRLLGTAYITGALAATLYGLSTLVIAPMSAALTDARRDLATHTSAHLETTNHKLADLVSTIPDLSKPKSTTARNPDSPEDDDDDNESTASDPTELFSRDIGTQTSPQPQTPPTTSSSTSTASTSPPTPIEKQHSRLTALRAHLESLLDSTESNRTTVLDTQSEITDFRSHLDRIVYSPPSYLYGSADSVWGTGGGGGGGSGGGLGGNSASAGGAQKKEDCVAALKAEIRGVKGVLLSAKRFPSASSVR